MMANCTCPVGLMTAHGPVMNQLGRSLNLDCPMHGREAMGLAKRPDAAPPKDEWEDQTLVEQATEILRYIDSDPKQGLVPNGRVELLRRTLAKAPPSDAAPVAWRWYIDGQTGGWRYSNVRITQSGKRQIVQPLYAHPEDAPRFLHPCSFCGLTGCCSAHTRTRADPTCKTCFGERAAHPEDAGGGPWRYKVNADGAYVIWNVLGDKDILEVKSEPRAIAVRNALNRVDRLEGGTDG